MTIQFHEGTDQRREREIDGSRSRAFRPTRLAHRRMIVVGLGVVTTLSMAAIIPASAADASTRATSPTEQGHIAASALAPRSASICNKVSAAAVAAIVGHSAPAQTAADSSQKYSAAETGVGVPGVVTACLYGTGGTFILQFTSATKPLTVSGVEKVIKSSATTSDQVKFTSFSGLGVPGFQVATVSSGIHTQEIAGVSGKTLFSAGTSSSLSMSKLAALAKLAKKL